MYAETAYDHQERRGARHNYRRAIRDVEETRVVGAHVIPVVRHAIGVPPSSPTLTSPKEESKYNGRRIGFLAEPTSLLPQRIPDIGSFPFPLVAAGKKSRGSGTPGWD